jgi:hypothetical protein
MAERAENSCYKSCRQLWQKEVFPALAACQFEAFFFGLLAGAASS